MGIENPSVIKKDSRAVKMNRLSMKKHNTSPINTNKVVICATGMFMIFGGDTPAATKALLIIINVKIKRVSEFKIIEINCAFFRFFKLSSVSFELANFNNKEKEFAIINPP
ncbi:MAG: hypothetical protein LBR09_00990 [Endomicrobium sp.]|nr:hypothetical protein [Endomicrobium sp.]